MLIGDKSVFAIECHHEPIPNEAGRVFGRMCIWFSGQSFGDVDESAMLNVTEGSFRAVLAELDSHDEPSLVSLSPQAMFELLDRALYRGEKRSMAQIVDDARRYRRFDFLTNGGESFDRTKSFIVNIGDCVRLLLEDEDYRLHSADVPLATFVSVVAGFLNWIQGEGADLRLTRH